MVSEKTVRDISRETFCLTIEELFNYWSLFTPIDNDESLHTCTNFKYLKINVDFKHFISISFLYHHEDFLNK